MTHVDGVKVNKMGFVTQQEAEAVATRLRQAELSVHELTTKVVALLSFG